VSARADGRRARCFAVGYDRSEGARRAASWAAAQLQPDGKLVIVHAGRGLHAPPSPLSTQSERAAVGRAVVDELLLGGEDTMRDLELAAEILDEDPVSALIDAAKRHGVDAIVLGSGPHRRLEKALGVVTSELLTRSPVPVIVVPPQAS